VAVGQEKTRPSGEGKTPNKAPGASTGRLPFRPERERSSSLRDFLSEMKRAREARSSRLFVGFKL